MGATTIRIFLADGTPLGIRVIEESNWSGIGIDFARSDWARARTRDDFSRPGVYVLTGISDDGVARVYVGEADVLATRIGQHFSGPAAKDFWTRATVFCSKDANLNKAHVRLIESRLVGLGVAAKQAKIENANVPAAPSLSDSDRSDAETFLEHMLLVYPVLGIRAFEAPPSLPAKLDAAGVLSLKNRRIEALGADTPAGFVVYAGSHATADETPALHEYVRKLRAKLVADGTLVPDGLTLRLTQAHVFGSPSTAAAVMLGRPANGRIEWKDAKGKTLKELQA